MQNKTAEKSVGMAFYIVWWTDFVCVGVASQNVVMSQISPFCMANCQLRNAVVFCWNRRLAYDRRPLAGRKTILFAVKHGQLMDKLRLFTTLNAVVGDAKCRLFRWQMPLLSPINGLQKMLKRHIWLHTLALLPATFSVIACYVCTLLRALFLSEAGKFYTVPFLSVKWKFR